MTAERGFAASTRSLRKAHRLSQTDLAEKVGLSKAALLRIETGQRHVSLNEAVRISEFFGVPLEKMIAGVDPKVRVDV